MAFIIQNAPYESSTKIYALEQMRAYDNQHRLNFNLDCQRGLVWTETQKQNLIDTLMFKERIPEIHVIKEDASPMFDVADGKQRLTTILDFLNDRLKWKRKYADEQFLYLFGGKNEICFSELPQEVQYSILSLEIPVATYKNITPKGVIKLFRKLNSGSQLNNFQKNMASNAILRTNYSDKILHHPVLKRIFTERKLNSDLCEEYLIDILVLLLAADSNGKRPKAVTITNDDIFKYNENTYLKDGLILNNKELEKWLQDLSEKVKIVNHYLDILNEEKNLYFFSAKAQFLLPILYAYCYNLSNKQFLEMYHLFKGVNVKSIVGGGTNYSKYALSEWYKFVSKNILPLIV